MVALLPTATRWSNPAVNQPPAGAHPPFPRVALRVGVTGHRPNRLPVPEFAGPAIRRVFESVARVLLDLPPELLTVSAPDRPLLRVLTGLAEGADRIAASEALLLRGRPQGPEVELQSVLPFPREECRSDFETASSVAEFEELLASSSAVLELDGSHGEPGDAAAERSYEYMGEMLLRSCDLLVALWDGGPSRGRGGSVFILQRARALGIPVAWVDARDGTLRISTDSTAWVEFSEAKLRSVVLSLLMPPSAQESRSGRAFFAEAQPGRGVFRRAWPLFRILGAGPSARLAPTPPQPLEGPLSRASSPGSSGLFGPHYSWANALAIAYADRFRSSFLVISLAAALAVLFSVIGSAVEHETRGAIAALVAIAAAIGVWVRGTRGRWHERWIDYRLMAELLRDMAALWPIGAGPPAARLPAHAGPGDPGTTWVAWHVRRVQRAAGLPNARLDPSSLHDVRENLRREWIGGQLRYHAANSAFHRRLDRRLAIFGFGSFVFTLGALAWFIATDRDDIRLFEAGLPALAAWCATIRGHAELERVARRSGAMAEGLRHLQEELLAIPLSGGPAASRELVTTAEGTADTLISEVLDWRVMLGSRRLELPG